MADSDRVNVELTRADLEFLQKARARHEVPGAVGQPMPFVEAERPWGVAAPANPISIQRLPSPTQWVAKQIGNLRAVGETNYRVGITTPKKSPIQAGIAAQAKYEAKMRDPAVLARRVAGLRKSSDEEWAAVAENIGARRLVEGVEARIHKVERAVGSLHSKMGAHLNRIDAMPNASDADSERRMVENLKGLRAMKGTI